MAILIFALLLLISFSACDPINNLLNNREDPNEQNSFKETGAEDENVLLEGGGMILTFDDGYSTDYEVVYPILEEKDLKAVTYISPIFIEEKVEGYMSWDQVKALDEAGWDIEDHTYSHANLKELTEPEIHEELQKVDDIFEEMGLDIPKHHAFPHGTYNESITDIVFTYRKTARKAENTLNSFPLESNIIDAIDMGIHSEEALKGFIDDAVNKNKLIFFFTHDVQDEPYDYGITTDKFKSVVEYSIEKEINILTLTELMEKQENVRENKRKK